MGFYEAYGKRILDLCLALVLIVILIPVFVIIIIAYVVAFSFPIFYSQQRIGKDRKIFNLTKFRSLRNSTGAPGERRFLLGDILRFASLDELPQLFQVVAGKMSCIGPRPLPSEYLPLFSDEQQQRHNIRPGITGWAQVNGRNSIDWVTKLALDVYYVKHISFWFDVRILLRTALMLVSFKRDVSLNEEKFTGKE